MTARVLALGIADFRTGDSVSTTMKTIQMLGIVTAYKPVVEWHLSHPVGILGEEWKVHGWLLLDNDIFISLVSGSLQELSIWVPS
jgi:hypothetical protein